MKDEEDQSARENQEFWNMVTSQPGAAGAAVPVQHDDFGTAIKMNVLYQEDDDPGNELKDKEKRRRTRRTKRRRKKKEEETVTKDATYGVAVFIIVCSLYCLLSTYARSAVGPPPSVFLQHV